MPVIELARHLGDVEVGELLAVVAHDPAAAVDVPAWCRMKEQDYVGADTADDGAPRYVVRRAQLTVRARGGQGRIVWRCGSKSATASSP